MAAATPLGLTDVQDALRIYQDKKIGMVMHGRKHRLGINQMNKKSNCGGQDYRVTVLGDWEGGVSADYTTAEAYAADGEPEAFLVGANMKQIHRTARLGTDLILAYEDDSDALFEKTFFKADMAVEQAVNEAERLVWGDGYGTLATVDGAPGASSCVVSPKQNAAFFKKGMGVQAAATLGGTLIDSSAVAVVLSNNPVTGTVTFTAAISGTLASLADTNYLFPAGSADLGIQGVKAWSLGTSSTFLGVDVTAAPTKLAMLSYTGGLSDIKDSITGADALANAVNGGIRDVFACNPQLFDKLQSEIGSQTQFSPGTKAMAGYSFIEIAGQHGGPIKVVTSPYIDYVPSTSAIGYLMNWQSWKICHNRKSVVFIDDINGNSLHRVNGKSAYHIDALARFQVVSNSPGQSVRINFS